MDGTTLAATGKPQRLEPPRGPRVEVSARTDLQLCPPGKRCARAGLPHLPGGLQRSHSNPGVVLASPGCALFEEQCSRAEARLHHTRSVKEVAKRTHDMTTGSVMTLTAPRASSSGVKPEGLSASAAMNGTLDLSSLSAAEVAQAFHGYDSRKHGWHVPSGHAEQTRLLDPGEQGSWAWTMRKARDHIGYGDIANPNVNRSDFQGTAISGDAPDWFIGTRTLDAPFSTKTVPARRCPRVTIEGKEMKVRAKTFKQGEGLSTTVTIHDSSRPPTPTKREDPRPKWMIAADVQRLETPRPKRSHLEGSGGRVRSERLPVSNFATKDPRYMHLSMHTMRAG
mmetsp:Transcript_11057/g.25312  ORF Transcript_11057/g.25312 Transcript_11057/m.25312 type:complete len:338 (+) Transcript_11057:55-1068(+)